MRSTPLPLAMAGPQKAALFCPWALAGTRNELAIFYTLCFCKHHCGLLLGDLRGERQKQARH
jgi:hypothetical protein